MVKLVRPRPAAGAPTITVVIPCYNYGHFLPHVVDSVLSQPNVRPFVIIVDDASPDGSGEVADKLAVDDDRITVVHNEKNLGHIATYNVGLSRVTSTYVSLVSADDLLTPGALGRATALMESHPSVGLVYGLTRSFSDQPPAPPRANGPWTVWPGHQWIDWACRRGRNFIMSPEVVMRTEALHQVGLYNPQLPHSGDLEFWLRTAARWDIGRVNWNVQAFYRVHASNMHLTTFATMPVDLRHRRSAFDVLAEFSGPRYPQARQDLSRAHRAIAREAVLLAERHVDSGGTPESARALLDVAVETYPRISASRRAQSVERRLQAASLSPSVALATRRHLVRESTRRQVDRLRWKFWNTIGAS